MLITENFKDFADKMKKEKGLSGKEVAQLLGLSLVNFYIKKRSEKPISSELAFKIYNTFNTLVKPHDLEYLTKLHGPVTRPVEEAPVMTSPSQENVDTAATPN